MSFVVGFLIACVGCWIASARYRKVMTRDNLRLDVLRKTAELRVTMLQGQIENLSDKLRHAKERQEASESRLRKMEQLNRAGIRE